MDVQGLEALCFTIYLLLSFHEDLVTGILNIGQTAHVSSHKHSLVSYGRQRCLSVFVEIAHGSWLRFEGGIFQIFLCVSILERLDALLSFLDLGLSLDRFAEHYGLLECLRLIPTIIFDTDSKLVLFVHDFVHLVDHSLLSLEECCFVDCARLDLLVKLIKILDVHLQ